MIQDQYEEEYFVSYLNPKTQNEGSIHSSPNSGKAADGASDQGMVYKYFSELNEDEVKRYETRPDIG